MKQFIYGFVGLGLIGGSLARSIRRVHDGYRLFAYDPDAETLRTAKENGIIDESPCSPIT